MKKPNPFVTKAEMIELLAKEPNLTRREIAHRYGQSYSYVVSRLLTWGIPLRHAGQPSRKLPPDSQLGIDFGHMTVAQVAERYGVAKQSVYRAWHKLQKEREAKKEAARQAEQLVRDSVPMAVFFCQAGEGHIANPIMSGVIKARTVESAKEIFRQQLHEKGYRWIDPETYAWVALEEAALEADKRGDEILAISLVHTKKEPQ